MIWITKDKKFINGLQQQNSKNFVNGLQKLAPCTYELPEFAVLAGRNSGFVLKLGFAAVMSRWQGL